MFLAHVTHSSELRTPYLRSSFIDWVINWEALVVGVAPIRNCGIPVSAVGIEALLRLKLIQSI